MSYKLLLKFSCIKKAYIYILKLIFQLFVLGTAENSFTQSCPIQYLSSRFTRNYALVGHLQQPVTCGHYGNISDRSRTNQNARSTALPYTNSRARNVLSCYKEKLIASTQPRVRLLSHFPEFLFRKNNPQHTKRM